MICRIKYEARQDAPQDRRDWSADFADIEELLDFIQVCGKRGYHVVVSAGAAKSDVPRLSDLPCLHLCRRI